MQNMTKISKIMYNKATYIQTISEAKNALLESEELFRSLKTILQSFSGMENPKKFLVDNLVLWRTDIGRESIDRNVRNWLNGNTQKIKKRDVFILSRILHLSLEKTDEFMKMILGEGIHWRNPEDIAWCYSIVHDLEPNQTLKLLQQVIALGKFPKETPLIPSNSYTKEVYEKLNDVLYTSEEELFSFLKKEWANLGTFHNTAYRLFMNFMNLLHNGSLEEEEQTKKKTTRDILEEYMYRKWITVEHKEEKKFSAIQRSIRQNWPDEVALSNMKSRSIDVSRKVLILLFLATDGSNSDFSEDDEDEEILTADDVFYDIYTRLNAMLQTCGFERLDARNPFDWIILYSICVGDLWESDKRLQEILIDIFYEEDENI